MYITSQVISVEGIAGKCDILIGLAEDKQLFCVSGVGLYKGECMPFGPLVNSSRTFHRLIEITLKCFRTVLPTWVTELRTQNIYLLR